MRLFREELPIAEFDRAKLGPQGTVHTIDQPDGAQLRNTLHNRVKADAFIPAGGRPATIHRRNWRDFLDEFGVPSSKVIVEGANLFLTPAAREALSAEGVVIVQDSSANKCGVICSSFEIAACMLLVEEDIIAIKSTFVEQVLERLRSLARLEAVLLIAEHARHPEVSLPELSIKLSKVINGTAPIIAESIPSWNDTDLALARQLVVDHLPPVLLEVVGDKVYETLPERYIHWLMANRLASGIAYREGIDFLSDMEPEAIVELVLNYLRKDMDLRQLIARVSSSNLPDRDRVIALLERGGVRAALHDH
jgi:glutamate dehydrogenase